MLSKTFDPKDIEDRLYKSWEDSGTFRPSGEQDAEKFVVMMPPPNVTGTLHMGHALNYTLQDTMVRYHRMKGYDTLWQPGSDHAGIATQMVVERQLDKQGLKRTELGRQKFLERVWSWRHTSGNIILNQQRRLGLSPDWTKSRFTMDEGLSKAVKKVFIDLYNEGLIYKDKRLVNWDPKLQTSVSDLEVINKESKGSLWYIRYPLEGQKDKFLTIATTRPETMFADSAIAVHPEDERYKDLVGSRAILPIANRPIPIIADEYCDMEKGSGAVKITPAHDFNDFDVGTRHDLERINILDENAYLLDNVPEGYQGLERFEARKKVIIHLEELDLLDKIEEVENTLPMGEKSDAIIEPRLTDQWFVDAKTLAQPAMEAVRTGKTKLVPERQEHIYFQWLEDIQPWCISRQLWWGHRIPAWYGPDGHIFVANDDEDAQKQADAHYGKAVTLEQDNDVLDTWFSSALWPFSTLGWPDKNPDLRRYYPSSVLVTGTDILFFWVARMMMMGLKFMGEVPFHTVYLHALVRDEKGQKMSKSKGNIVDPLDIMEKYGADALRFTMSILATPGRDVKYSTSIVEGYRNFATKIWNAARLCEFYECEYDQNFDPYSCKLPINKWIVSNLRTLMQTVEDRIQNYRSDEAASKLYQFIWGQFCDWYLELAKVSLTGDDQDAKTETQKVAAWVLAQICHLMHPFMPFITEELWQNMKASDQSDLISRSWPNYKELPQHDAINEDFEWLTALVSSIRAARTEVNVPPKAQLSLLVQDADETTIKRLETYHPYLSRLARIEGFITNSGSSDNLKGSIQTIVMGVTYVLPVSNIIDLDAEKNRLQKTLKELEKEMLSLDKKLSNQDFVAKAPPQVIEKNKTRYNDAKEKSIKITEALSRLN